MEENLLGLFASSPFIASFLSGILTFLSPCILPLIPAYLSYISGYSIEELKSSTTSVMRKNALIGSLLFCLGFSLTFVVLGSALIEALSAFSNSFYVKLVAGALIVFLGLHFIFHFNFSFLYKQKSLTLDNKISKNRFFSRYLIPFVFGVSFALSWTPCVGPILAAVMALAFSNKEHAVVLLSAYSVGLAIPFVLCALLINSMLKACKNLNKYLRIIEIVSGVLLLIIGVLIITDSTSIISDLFI